MQPGEGLAHVAGAMEALGKRAAFATARVTNDRITKILELNNFEIVGREYPSDDDSSRLLRLFVRPASSHAALETQE
jgi:hypothetical protein